MSESTPQPASDTQRIDVTIVTGDLKTEEIAAVTAVVQSAVAGASAPSAGADAASRIDAGGWEKSRRDLRTPIHPGAGEWRRHD